MICSKCKNGFYKGIRPDGLPNGVGFEMEDGLVIHLCANCIMELGKLDRESQEEFIGELVEEARKKP